MTKIIVQKKTQAVQITRQIKTSNLQKEVSKNKTACESSYLATELKLLYCTNFSNCTHYFYFCLT